MCILFPSSSDVEVVTDVRRLPGSAYVRICDSIKKIIEGINPDIVVVDSLFNPGFDACYSLNCRFVMSTPNTPMVIERFHLPWLKGLWHYPTFVLPTRLPSSHRSLPFRLGSVPEYHSRSHGVISHGCHRSHMEHCKISSDFRTQQVPQRPWPPRRGTYHDNCPCPRSPRHLSRCPRH